MRQISPAEQGGPSDSMVNPATRATFPWTFIGSMSRAVRWISIQSSAMHLLERSRTAWDSARRSRFQNAAARAPAQIGNEVPRLHLRTHDLLVRFHDLVPDLHHEVEGDRGLFGGDHDLMDVLDLAGGEPLDRLNGLELQLVHLTERLIQHGAGLTPPCRSARRPADP